MSATHPTRPGSRRYWAAPPPPRRLRSRLRVILAGRQALDQLGITAVLGKVSQDGGHRFPDDPATIYRHPVPRAPAAQGRSRLGGLLVAATIGRAEQLRGPRQTYSTRHRASTSRDRLRY